MENLDDNVQEHPVTKFKKGLKAVKDFVVAWNTPLDPSEYILSFGKSTLNTNTGLFSYVGRG